MRTKGEVNLKVLSNSFISSVKASKTVGFITEKNKVGYKVDFSYTSHLCSVTVRLGPGGCCTHGLAQNTIWHKTELVCLEGKSLKQHYKKAIYLRSVVQLLTGQGMCHRDWSAVHWSTYINLSYEKKWSLYQQVYNKYTLEHKAGQIQRTTLNLNI